MLYWTEFYGYDKEIQGKRKLFDNTIFTFDIETTSYIYLDGKVLNSKEYDNLSQDSKDRAIYQANMYIWQFSINDKVYYGREWDELLRFLEILNDYTPEKKFVYVHNLGFEFEWLSSIIKFNEVMARVTRSPMKAISEKYNIEFRCSLMLTNCKLEYIPKVFNLDVSKKVGDLDYQKIRNSKTKLTKKELGYCEYDCLVLYKYLLIERKAYGSIKDIPLTSTGHVRRELKERIETNKQYKTKVRKAINTDGHVYDLMIKAFAGGYTHSNWIYTDEVLHNITSYDFTSSYPYVMVAYKFPMSTFKKIYLKNLDSMVPNFAYLLHLKLYNLKVITDNTFISVSKCVNIKNGVYDNGRIISADEIEIYLTDVDISYIKESYKYDVEIIESYYAVYDYLPKELINFILDKYENKTKYKGIESKAVEYAKEKNKFNSIYGMCVTNEIRDKVEYDNGWQEEKLTQQEILNMLKDNYKKGFLSFSWGVWVTAIARANLIHNIIKLDRWSVYSDTDSIKLLPGYDENIIKEYNRQVIKRIENVSKILSIDINRFCPKDIKGEKRWLGVFDNDGEYEDFITQGAKKYAITRWIKNEKLSKSNNVLERKGNKSKILEITVSGVPKSGAKALKSVDEFRDNFIFRNDVTGKNYVAYNDEQIPVEITDYQGNTEIVNDKKGICILPCTYELGKAEEYGDLIDSASSRRAIYGGE